MPSARVAVVMSSAAGETNFVEPPSGKSAENYFEGNVRLDEGHEHGSRCIGAIRSPFL